MARTIAGAKCVRAVIRNVEALIACAHARARVAYPMTATVIGARNPSVGTLGLIVVQVACAFTSGCIANTMATAVTRARLSVAIRLDPLSIAGTIAGLAITEAVAAAVHWTRKGALRAIIAIPSGMASTFRSEIVAVSVVVAVVRARCDEAIGQSKKWITTALPSLNVACSMSAAIVVAWNVRNVATLTRIILIARAIASQRIASSVI